MVYYFFCDDCNKKHNRRDIQDAKDHAKRTHNKTSAIAEHLKYSGHRIKIENKKILQKEPIYAKGQDKMKEATQIHEERPMPNQDQGMEIQQSY